MPTYIGLLNWTDQGARTVKDTINRSEKAREIAKRVGAELRDVYWTMGPHDVVGLIEAPDDDTASAFTLALAATGNIRGVTMRTFGVDEMRAILDKLP